jgi:hypothetical protein
MKSVPTWDNLRRVSLYLALIWIIIATIAVAFHWDRLFQPNLAWRLALTLTLIITPAVIFACMSVVSDWIYRRKMNRKILLDSGVIERLGLSLIIATGIMSLIHMGRVMIVILTNAPPDDTLIVFLLAWVFIRITGLVIGAGLIVWAIKTEG